MEKCFPCEGSQAAEQAALSDCAISMLWGLKVWLDHGLSSLIWPWSWTRNFLRSPQEFFNDIMNLWTGNVHYSDQAFYSYFSFTLKKWTHPWKKQNLTRANLNVRNYSECIKNNSDNSCFEFIFVNCRYRNYSKGQRVFEFLTLEKQKEIQWKCELFIKYL